MPLTGPVLDAHPSSIPTPNPDQDPDQAPYDPYDSQDGYDGLSLDPTPDDPMGVLLSFPGPQAGSGTQAQAPTTPTMGAPRARHQPASAELPAITPTSTSTATATPTPTPTTPTRPLLTTYSPPIPPSLIIPSRGSYSLISELVRNRELYQATDDDPCIRIKNYPSTLRTAIDCTVYQVPVSRPGRGTVLACALHHGLDMLELDPLIEELDSLRARLHGPDSLSYLSLGKRQAIADWMNRCPLRPDAMTTPGDTVSDLQIRIPKKSHNRVCGISDVLGTPSYAILLWCVMAGLSDQDHLREYSEMFSRAAKEFVDVLKARLAMYQTLLGPWQLGEI